MIFIHLSVLKSHHYNYYCQGGLNTPVLLFGKRILSETFFEQKTSICRFFPFQELGRSWEDIMADEDTDIWRELKREEYNWSDWREEVSQFWVCLFCLDAHFDSPDKFTQHLATHHHFTFEVRSLVEKKHKSCKNLTRSCKTMHFSGRCLARFLQDIPHFARFLQKIFFCQVLARNVFSARILQDSYFLSRSCKNLLLYYILSKNYIYFQPGIP